MKARVFVTLKSGVLDPAGQAVEKNLLRLGFDGVSGVRIGKMVELTLDPKSASSKAEAEKLVGKMCDKLIANTVIEDYRVEIE